MYINWKEDGVRSIADKILKRLHDLDKTLHVNQGRWIWELLQNAKDSVVESNRRVSVKVEICQNYLKFRHNGDHFSEMDIRGLVNQISSKELIDDSPRAKTGRFGTGFLITHLLSKVVEVEGLLKESNDEVYQFKFKIDREATGVRKLIEKIEATWNAFHLEANATNMRDKKIGYNTCFTYPLKNKKVRYIARKGITEFELLLPMVLAHISAIEDVEILDSASGRSVKYVNMQTHVSGNIMKINKMENGRSFPIYLLFKRDGDLSIALNIEKKGGHYIINSLRDRPKLFCDFPLIGTESFCFPVVINSSRFNPTTEREGIWLMGEEDKEVMENREILLEASDLFRELIGTLEVEKLKCTYNLCNVKIPELSNIVFDSNWYENYISRELKKILADAKIVETQSNKYASISDVYFIDPHFCQRDRETAWHFSHTLKRTTLTTKDDLHNWTNVIWNECNRVDIDDLISDFCVNSNRDQLFNVLGTEIDSTYKWINSFIQFVYKHAGLISFDEHQLLLNQAGDFCRRSDLYRDKIKDSTLMKIALLLGFDYYELLMDVNIDFKDTYDSLAITNIAEDINDGLFSTGVERNSRLQAIKLLIEWFENNKACSEKYFKKLYQDRGNLLMETIEDKETLFSIMKSKMPLSEVATIVEALENDQELYEDLKDIIEERRRQQMQVLYGESIERSLQNALTSAGFVIHKEHVGRDLVVKLQRGGLFYSIEVKTAAGDQAVLLSRAQASLATKEPRTYALAVIKAGRRKINEKSIIENSFFITDIGLLLRNAVSIVKKVEKFHDSIEYQAQGIEVFIEYPVIYKYKISNDIWKKGMSFNEFVSYLKNLD